MLIFLENEDLGKMGFQRRFLCLSALMLCGNVIYFYACCGVVLLYVVLRASLHLYVCAALLRAFLFWLPALMLRGTLVYFYVYGCVLLLYIDVCATCIFILYVWCCMILMACVQHGTLYIDHLNPCICIHVFVYMYV